MSDHNNETLGALWDRLNDPTRFATPQSTVEAIMFAVRERGIAALQEPANAERLSQCDDAASAEIKRRIAKLRDRVMAPNKSSGEQS